MHPEGSVETNEKKSKGVLALEKLQNNGYRLWTVEEIDEYRIPKTHLPSSNLTKEMLRFIARENSRKIIHSNPDLKKRFRLGASPKRLYMLERLKMAFSVAIEEIVAYYGLKCLGYWSGRFYLPPELDWLKPYLKGKGRYGDILSWQERIKPNIIRKAKFPSHWIALLHNYPLKGKACYEPLGLHIPKLELTLRV